jgi:hypothetical protein
VCGPEDYKSEMKSHRFLRNTVEILTAAFWSRKIESSQEGERRSGVRGRGGGNGDLSRASGLVLLDGRRLLCFPRRTLPRNKRERVTLVWLRPVKTDNPGFAVGSSWHVRAGNHPSVSGATI